MTDRGDDLELAATMRAVSSHQHGFADFYLTEYRPMVALAAAVSGSRTAAEDIAQEAMLRALRHWDRIAAYDKPGAWARRVTINLASSHLRRLRLEARSLLRLGADRRSVPPPAAEHQEVWDAVAMLPGRQRAAVALFYLEDRSVEEIAELLGCSQSTARVHLHRGRRALAHRLGDHDER